MSSNKNGESETNYIAKEERLCDVSISLSKASTPYISEDEFAQRFLEAHNRFRKLHGVPSLRLSEELCTQARQWAQRIARKRHMSYCELAGIGECITFFPQNINPEEIVAYWYEEHKKYEYEMPGWQAGTNYFTQIVWNSTTELGVGRAPVRAIIDPLSRQRSTSMSSAASSIAPSPTTSARDWTDADSTLAKANSNGVILRQQKAHEISNVAEEEQVVVAFYRPAGNNNRTGQFALNVFKPLKLNINT